MFKKKTQNPAQIIANNEVIADNQQKPLIIKEEIGYIPLPPLIIEPREESVIINHLLTEITMLKQMLEDKKNELIRRL